MLIAACIALSVVQVALNLDQYLLINDSKKHGMMSVQKTSSTCYFQTYLFGVLSRVCNLRLADQMPLQLDLENKDLLGEVTVTICRHLLGFFASDAIVRPLSNSNFVLDFHRYEDSPYFALVTQYLHDSQASTSSSLNRQGS